MYAYWTGRYHLRTTNRMGSPATGPQLYLKTEECEVFLLALIQGDHALPADYHQWQEEKAGIVCLRLEAIESPEIFAERIAASLQKLGP